MLRVALALMDISMNQYIEKDLFNLFRMETFNVLLTTIDCEHFHKPYSGGGVYEPVEKQLLMTRGG